jgi:mannan endo-1,4-beta-mannosidase
MSLSSKAKSRPLGLFGVSGICFGVALFTFVSCSLFPFRSTPEYFVTVKAGRLIKGEQVYAFTGANLWYGMYLGSPGRTGDRARLLRELDTLASHHIRNLRILGASEQSYIRWAMKPALQNAPGVFDDSLLCGLDFLLDAMHQRGMRAVVYLNNYWEWSGGMAQYNVWAGDGRGVDPEDSTFGWPAYMEYSASFYGNGKATALFRSFLRTIVGRENTENGRRYAEDPTIMAWQLANEPRPGTVSAKGEANIPAYNRWLSETAAYLHQLDTNHLVSTGSEGIVGSLLKPEYYFAAHNVPQIDYLTFHLWPMNWHWFDAYQPAATYATAESLSVDYIQQHLLLARWLGKPIVLEEFGFPRDSLKIDRGTSISWRNRFYERVLSLIADSAAAGAPVAGSNFWGWGGLAARRNVDGKWREGDPLMGDPPQEPQGLYSVFGSDTTTIRIVEENGKRMQGVRKN